MGERERSSWAMRMGAPLGAGLPGKRAGRLPAGPQSSGYAVQPLRAVEPRQGSDRPASRSRRRARLVGRPEMTRITTQERDGA